MTPTETLTLEQEARQVGQEAMAVVKKAEALKVTDQVTRIQAAELGRVVATLDAAAKEKFDAIKKPLTEAKNRILAWEHEVRDPLTRVKGHLSIAIGTFDQAQERARRAEEERIRKELQDQAEADAKAASEAQAIADAIALENAGDSKGAEAVLNNPVPQPVYVPPVILQRETVKTAGVASQQTWKFRIENPELIPREYLIPDEKVIGQIGRALKEKANIPGVQFYPEGGARFTKA
jgi:hypothetical protein